MKFLVVDDNDQFRAYLKELILNPGDEYRELDDGYSVTKVYREFHPDWTLLDIRMKKVDGFKAAQSLAAHFPKAKFAFISEFADSRFRSKAKELGAAAFFAKDNLIELPDLIAQIEVKAEAEIEEEVQGAEHNKKLKMENGKLNCE